MRPECITLSSPVSLYFNLLYSLLNETLWNIQTFTWRISVCVCVCLSSLPCNYPFILASPGCVSALFDLSLSLTTDRWSETIDRETDTGIHLHAPADRRDLRWDNDLFFQDLPSSWWRVRARSGSLSLREGARWLWVCWPHSGPLLVFFHSHSPSFSFVLSLPEHNAKSSKPFN